MCNLQVHSNMYGQLIFKNGTKVIKCGKGNLFMKWCLNNWVSIIKWTSPFPSHQIKNKFIINYIFKCRKQKIKFRKMHNCYRQTFIRQNTSKLEVSGHLGGSVSQVSDTWTQLRSWSQDCEFRPHTGPHTGCEVYFKKK